MDIFYEHLIVRGATIDEFLSDDFERLPGQKGDTDLSGGRAAFCVRPVAFEHLLAPLADLAEAKLWVGIDARRAAT
jgi:hypothetical protein